MSRRLFALPLTAILLGSFAAVAWSGMASASGGGQQVTFQVSDARAYAYKVSIAQPVVQAAAKPTACDPKKDKYKCQTYDRQPNCPSKVAFGARKQPPEAQPPENVTPLSGGAGQGAGQNPSGTGVPQSSAVRLDRLLTQASLGREGTVLTSNGLGALKYVENAAPPWNDNGAHTEYAYTETDAFVPNQDGYEERCYAQTSGDYDPKKSSTVKPGDDFAHMFSHSYRTPESFHYAECFQSQCQLNTSPLSPAAAHGLTLVHLVQTGNVVRGTISAELENLTFPGSFFEVNELKTYIQFESDGTASGLKWQVVTTAQGAHLAGQPINLPHGQSIELGNPTEQFSVGVAGPYVSAPKDGSLLTIVAPGMFVATSQQTAFFAGAEMTANFGRGITPTFPGPLPSFSPRRGGAAPGVSTGSGGTTISSGGTGPFPQAPTGGGGSTTNTAPLPQTQPQFALLSKHDPPWAPVSILALGALGLLMAFLRWAQQFEWGKRMYEVQPMRSFEWLYRAFVKT